MEDIEFFMIIIHLKSKHFLVIKIDSLSISSQADIISPNSRLAAANVRRAAAKFSTPFWMKIKEIEKLKSTVVIL